MPSELNKILTESLKRIVAFKEAKRRLEEFDEFFRQYIKGRADETQSPKDESGFYKE